MKKQNVVMVVVAVILCAVCIAIDFAFYPPTNELTDQEVAEMYYENDHDYEIEGEYEVVIGHSAEMPQGNTLTNVWAYSPEGEVVGIASIDLDFYRSMFTD